MSDQHDFDELARRKLDERRFSPQEEDWLAAQRLIAEARPAKKRRRALILFALLGLIGGAGWWLTDAGSIEKTEVSAAVRPSNATDNHGAYTEERGTTTESTAEIAETIAPDRTEPAAMTGSDQRTLPDVTAPDQPTPMIGSSEVAQRSTTPQVRWQNDTPGTSNELGALTSTGAPNGSKPAHDSDDVLVISNTASTSSPGLPSVDGPPQDQRVEAASSVGSNTSLTPPPDTVYTITLDATEPSDDYYATPDSNIFTTTRDTVALTPTVIATSDTSIAAQDTTARTAVTRSPWEFSLLGGALISTSNYSGGGSDLWSHGSTGRWAPAFGAEIMHMGHNFGIGGGIHHVTYAEDLDVRSQSTTTTVIRDSNYFQSVDTTLFIVTGTTVIDGQTYYITQPFQTTVQLLINGTATIVNTQELVRAMKAANRVSYLEIPLLGDAHLDRGAWSFGIRGGPTVGLLTSRTGSLPTTISDGSLVSSERTFKSTIFGAMGRAYIRYRFCGSWTVGLEPTWRTQFGNALGSGDIVRRNSGWGGFISLSYRLR